MRKTLLTAAWATALGLLLPALGQSVEVNLLAKVTNLGTYSLELEVADFTNATSIDIVHPTFGRFALSFDSGENNWDVEAEDLDLAEVQTFFNENFDLEIIDALGAGQSIYRSTSPGPPGPGDFPEPASFLTVVPSANPLRPTARWVGGDETADAMIITYASGDDEFSDGFEAPEANSSRTLNQDLAPGFYSVAHGFYFSFGDLPLTLLTGEDLLGLDVYNLASVGEAFSQVSIVPVPAAAWLLMSALGLLVGLRRRQ